jgi:Domain of unknown function (DUF222)/HNH endonuclease
VALLAGALEAIADEDVERLTDCALADDLVTLRRHIDRLEYEFGRRLHRFDRARGYAAEGAASAVAWLRTTSRLSGGAAAQRVETARMLPELPLTERAARQGEIGFQHAAVIARCAVEVGSDTVRGVEATLVEAATKLDPGRLRLVTRHLRHCVDPDGTLRDANRDHERRWLRVSQSLDGVYFLDGLLDAEGGALVRSALGALERPLPGDQRSAAQRRADALVELATRQLQSGELPSANGQRPHLTITADAATLRGESGSRAADVHSAGPVPAETLRRLACDAALTRVSLALTGEPLDVGRTSRTVPPALRRALVLRDGGCTFPGCDRPPEWTDAHHLHHWADGGETSLDNLVLLCRVHHRTVHERGWRLSRTAQGEMVAAPP